MTFYDLNTNQIDDETPYLSKLTKQEFESLIRFINKKQTQAENLAREDETQKIIDILIKEGIMKDKIYPKIKPTHGNCCTCQDCGYNHDDCVCYSNELYEKLTNQSPTTVGLQRGGMQETSGQTLEIERLKSSEKGTKSSQIDTAEDAQSENNCVPASPIIQRQKMKEYAYVCPSCCLILETPCFKDSKCPDCNCKVGKEDILYLLTNQSQTTVLDSNLDSSNQSQQKNKDVCGSSPPDAVSLELREPPADISKCNNSCRCCSELNQAVEALFREGKERQKLAQEIEDNIWKKRRFVTGNTMSKSNEEQAYMKGWVDCYNKIQKYLGVKE